MYICYNKCGDIMKTCLVLEGGALRGIYTMGVLDTFLEENIEVDCVIGVSAGTLFGINYVSKQPKRVLNYNLEYAGNKDYMSLRSFIKTGNIINEKFCFHDLPDKLYPFDYDTFDKSKTKFYSVVTNVLTGLPEYIEIRNSRKQINVMRASGAMPIISEIVEINGNKYLDGGIGDSIPVQKAIDMGYDKIILIPTRPIDYRKHKTKMLPYKLKYKNYKNFLKTVENRPNMYNSEVEKIINLEKDNRIFVIRPTKHIKIKHMETNKNKIQAMYDLGVNDTKKKLNDLKKYLEK